MFREGGKDPIIEKKEKESELVDIEQISSENDFNDEKDNRLEQLKAQKTEEFLNKMAFIEKTDEGLVFDLEKFKNLKIHDVRDQLGFLYNNRTQRVNREDIFKFLNNQSGFSKNDPEKRIKPFFSLPLDLESAKKADFSDGHRLPWEAFSYPYFKNSARLQDGEYVTISDLFYLKRIKEIQLQRDKNDELVYYNEQDKKLERFSTKKSVQIFGRDISLKDDRNTSISFRNEPYLFIKKYLPLVDSLNIFNKSDFRRYYGSKSYYSFLTHDKKINNSGKNNYYNSVVDKVDIRYYLGKKNIIGTDKETEDNMFLRDLSTDTVGIIQGEHERKKILYTFDKISKSELTEMGAFKTGKDFFGIKKDEMVKRIKKYKISDFLPRRKDESPEAYANRLSDLNDVDFVTEKFRDVMEQAQVPVSQLSWPEQLMIANYAMSGTKAEKLIEFANRYGIDGLKAFLTVERDANIGQLIFYIGSKLEPNKAKLIFSKVSELGVLANKEKEELTEILLNNQDTSLVEGVYSKLINVAAGALREFQGVGNKKNKELKNIDNLMAKLQAIKTDNALLISVLKSAKEEGQVMTLEMIKNLNLEKKIINFQEGNLSQEEKSELLGIAQDNYSTIFLQTGSSYNPEAYKRVIDDFVKELNDLEGQTIYILKYKDEIIGFNRFKPFSPYEVYAGSFNISKDIQGLSIGKSFLAKTLDDVSASYDIHAKTRQDNPANNSYLKQGFVIVGEHQESDGVAYYNLIKPSRASSEKVA